MLSRKSAASLVVVALALSLHGAAFVLVVYGFHFPQFEPPPPPPLSMSVQLVAAPEPEPPAPVIEPVPPEPPQPEPAVRPAKPKQAVVKKAEIRTPIRDGATEAPPVAAAKATDAPSVSVSQAARAQTAARPATPVPAMPTQVKTGVSIPAKYALGNRPPVYPRLSIQYREQGIVTLRVFVNADETAGEVQIKTSSGYPLLDQAAVTAVQGWRFEPARLDGTPVGEWYPVNIPFKLLH